MNNRLISAMILSMPCWVSLASYADEVDNKFEVRPYGFILPKFNAETSGLKTFTTQTEIAPTAAASQLGVSNSFNHYGRATWQIGQSRFGVNIRGGEAISGRAEIDFFNNDDAEPEFSLLAPRLRIASIKYKFSDHLSITVGQFWDIFNGDVNPITYNPIGYYFQAGNAGFIRQQFAIKVGGDTGLNYTFAFGLPAKTDNAATGAPVSDGVNELSALPTLAANLTYKQSADEFSGIALIAGRVVYAGGTLTSDSHAAYGLSLFSSSKLSGVLLRAKLYYGQNLNNLNAQTLASGGGTAAGNNAYDLTEWGFYVSTWSPITDQLGLLLGVGYASSPTQLAGLLGAASSILTANLKVVAGLDYELIKNFKTFGEFNHFSSTYTETAGAIATAYTAEMLEVGFKYEFM